MQAWIKCLISPNTSILEAIQIIDRTAIQFAMVVGEERNLLGTVTDGDIRRAILQGISLKSNVAAIMNAKPIVASEKQDKHSILSIMKTKSIQQIPIVNSKGIVIGIEVLKNIICSETKPNSVVLMAGGLGTRLRPLTDSCPKPLLEIGSKPILETILDSFIDYGFQNFYFAVNYKAEMIKQHFGDGSKFGVEIHYLNEEKRMGTAGALSLLPKRQKEPLLVMNGDLLTKINFQHLLDFHIFHQSKATMCVREYNYQIPYGVVATKDSKIMHLQEKPVYSAFVNAGIYVISPEVLEMIPHNTFFDMPDLFNQIIANNEPTAAFPIREYWLDIGQKDDFEKAKLDFLGVFG